MQPAIALLNAPLDHLVSLDDIRLEVKAGSIVEVTVLSSARVKVGDLGLGHGVGVGDRLRGGHGGGRQHRELVNNCPLHLERKEGLV